MNDFGELLRRYRHQCQDPQSKKPLTQAKLAELLCLKCDLEGYSGATISNWERGKNQIRRDDRHILVGLIQVLYELGGLHSVTEAEQLLLAGNYRTLVESERERINPAWRHIPGWGEEGLTFPNVEEQVAQLPPASYGNLVGETALVAELLALLSIEKAPYLIMLVGIGGIGKTAVADAVVQKIIQRGTFAQVIWLSFASSQTIQTQENIFTTVLTLLGERLLSDSGQEPNLNKLLARVRSKLKRHRYLIIIDNLENTSETNVLLPQLQGLATPSKFLLTARHFPTPDSEIFSLTVPELSPPDALTLLKQQAEISGIKELAHLSLDDFTDIYDIVGGHPLALKLIPQLARRYPFTVVMSDWRERGPGYVEAVYDSIYTRVWQDLTAAEKHLLVAMLPVAQIGITSEQMRFVSDLPRNEFWPTVTKLIERCLLEIRGTTTQRRYGLHQLTANFLQANEKQALVDTISPVFVKKHIAYWQYHLETLSPTQIQHLDIDRHNIFQAIQNSLMLPEEEVTPELQVAWHSLSETLFRFVEQRGYGHEWKPILVRLTAKFHLDKPLYCHLLIRLGEIHRLTFSFSEAIDSLQQALRLATEIDDDWLMARSHFHLGSTHYQLRLYEEAKQHGETSLTLFTQGETSGREFAATHNLLGLIYRVLGNFTASANHLHQAIIIWREKKQYPELARTLNNLARTLQEQGQYDEALVCFQEAKKALKGTASELDRTLILLSEGTLFFEQDRYDEAEAAFNRIDLIYLQETHHLYYEALTLNNLANVNLVRKEYLEAEKRLQTCYTRWQQLGDDIEAAKTLCLLADAATGLGNEEAVKTFCLESLAKLEPYGDQPNAVQIRQEISERLQAAHTD